MYSHFMLREISCMPDCQRVRAAQIDAAVADAFLAALAPGELDALRGLGRHNSRSTRPCALALNGSLSASATPRRWQNASSIS